MAHLYVKVSSIVYTEAIMHIIQYSMMNQNTARAVIFSYTYLYTRNILIFSAGCHLSLKIAYMDLYERLQYNILQQIGREGEGEREVIKESSKQDTKVCLYIMWMSLEKNAFQIHFQQINQGAMCNPAVL